MVIKTVTTLELLDIDSIRIKCNSCGGEIVYAFKNVNSKPPAQCPQCWEEWWDGKIDNRPSEFRLIDKIEQLHKQLSTKNRKSGITLLFDINSHEKSNG